MDVRDLSVPDRAAELAEESVATVQRWLAAARDVPAPATEVRLARLLADPNGPEFARQFVDGVLRPADLRVAAHNLDRLSRAVPDSLKWHADVGTQLAGGFAPLLPHQIVPAVRDSFLRTVGGLFLHLGTRDPEGQLAKLAADGGVRPMLAPVGSPASGHREAHRQLLGVQDLLSRDDVSAVSISLVQLVGAARPLDQDGDVDYAVDQLEPLYGLAAHSLERKFINLDVEKYDELEITVRVFQQLSERHPQLVTGLSLPADLPDSLGVLERVTQWAMARQAASSRPGSGDAVSEPKTVIRIVAGDHSDDERARATARGWPSAAFAEQVDTDAQVLRLLDAALTRERCDAVRVVVATHTLFDTAFAWRLARERGVERSVDYEFLHGIGSGQVHAVKRDVGGVQLYVPTLQHQELALIAPYLMRRLDDRAAGTVAGAASSDNVTADTLPGKDRFLHAVRRAMDAPPTTLRVQSPDHAEATDFSIRANRDWAQAILRRARDSAVGEELVATATTHARVGAEALVSHAVLAGEQWGERRGTTRAEVLDSVAETLAEWRGTLVEVAVSESQLTLSEADNEVTIAIDAARQAAVQARQLDRVDGAQFVPPKLIVIVGSRDEPLSGPVPQILAALAAGAAVILKAAPESERSSAIALQALLAAGVPAGLTTLLCGQEGDAEHVITHTQVDRVLATGSRHTAKLFHSWSAELPLYATIGGRNSVIVTPSADLEAAVADVVAGALDHAGQAITATNVVILVGSVARSERFRGRLRDAISSVVTGSPFSPGTQLSSLARAASGSVLWALTELEGEETWLVRPQQVGTDGRVWMPGLRDGVAPGSTFHRAQNRAPVLGIMTAGSLAEAVELQNALGFGLAAGIHSTDPDELSTWLETANAGMLFVNRAVIPGARSTMPFVGWGRSSIGRGRASGGPNELFALGSWQPSFTEPGDSVTLTGVSDAVTELVEAAQPSMSFIEFDRVRTSVQNEEREWRAEFGVQHPLQDSPANSTVFRYRPLPVTIRLAQGAPISQLVRVLAAATRAGASVAVSSAVPLPAALIALFGSGHSPIDVSEVLVEDAVRWHARVQRGEVTTERIRLIGGDGAVLARVLHGQPGIAVEDAPITTHGRTELLTFLREQSISADVRRAHFWHPLWVD